MRDAEFEERSGSLRKKPAPEAQSVCVGEAFRELFNLLEQYAPFGTQRTITTGRWQHCASLKSIDNLPGMRLPALKRRVDSEVQKFHGLLLASHSG